MTPAPAWTVPDVERWLVIAFAADARAINPGLAEAVRWLERFVENLDERRSIHLWAWARAGGHSIRAILLERPRLGSRKTFERRRQAALEAIVAGLNGEECPVPQRQKTA